MKTGYQIYKWRLCKGLNQAQLAEKTGIFQPHIAAMESGTLRPGVNRLVRLASALGLRLSELLEKSPPVKEMDRFEIDRLCRSLVENNFTDFPLAKENWDDLVVTFFTRLKLIDEKTRRKRPRKSVNASWKRLNAVLGKKYLAHIDRRLTKVHTAAVG